MPQARLNLASAVAEEASLHSAQRRHHGSAVPPVTVGCSRLLRAWMARDQGPRNLSERRSVNPDLRREDGSRHPSDPRSTPERQ